MSLSIRFFYVLNYYNEKHFHDLLNLKQIGKADVCEYHTGRVRTNPLLNKMKQIKEYLKFFFQTERIHPLHVFALLCSLVSVITLAFEIIFAVMQKDFFQLIIQSLLTVCFVAIFFGFRQAYQKAQTTDSQDFRKE